MPKKGPGKFASTLDEVLYVSTLDGGADEEVGDAQDFGWYGLLRFSSEDAEEFKSIAAEEGIDISDGELETIEKNAGAIIHEDSNGHVSVSFIEEEDQLEEKWAEIVEEAEEFYEESGEEISD